MPTSPAPTMTFPFQELSDMKGLTTFRPVIPLRPMSAPLTGDLRLELQMRGFLPQAASGFPGAPEVTEYITIAESRWRQQLAGLGRTLGSEMLIAFPEEDETRRVVADFLREAQRQLGGNEIDSAMLQ